MPAKNAADCELSNNTLGSNAVREKHAPRTKLLQDAGVENTVAINRQAQTTGRNLPRAAGSLSSYNENINAADGAGMLRNKRQPQDKMINTNPTRPSPLRISLTAALLAFMLLPTAMVNALPGDRDKPIHITADKAVRDEQKGVTVYSGNVQMRQGSMELDADSLTIYHDDENADQIVARGNPAKMRQLPKPEAALVHAHASIITYFKSEDRVHLQTDARIEQAGDLVTGDSIDYLITKQLITAESDKSLAGDKVNVVLQPTVAPATSQPVATTPLAPETAVEAVDTTDHPNDTEEGLSGATESE